jgi:hypothetical protein
MITGFIVGLWLILLGKTVVLILRLDDPPSLLFYSEMLKPTWQSQFNLDLLFLIFIFSAWIFFRSSSKTAGLFWGLINIYLGGLFTLAYIAWTMSVTKGDMICFFMGRSSEAHLEKKVR